MKIICKNQNRFAAGHCTILRQKTDEEDPTFTDLKCLMKKVPYDNCRIYKIDIYEMDTIAQFKVFTSHTPPNYKQVNERNNCCLYSPS